MDVMLTKEADALICLLYKAYLERRSNGVARSVARSFGSVFSIQGDIAPAWALDDLDDVLRELGCSGLLRNICADEAVLHVTLEEPGLVYMEQRFRGKIDVVLDYLSKIKGIVPLI